MFTPETSIKPTPHQEQKLQELLAWWKLPRNHPDYWNCILSAPAGSGKAQPLTEPVLTPTGFIEMGAIKKGDYVISETGKPVKVLDTFTTENLNMYKITFTDKTFTYCCEDHLWLVYPEKLRKSNGTSILTLKQMLPLINRVKTTKEGYSFRIPVVKPIEFEEKVHLYSCYTFGYALGNGSSTKENRSSQLILTLAQADFDHIIKNIPEDYILSFTKNKSNTAVSLIALNESFRDFYNSFNLRGVTSLNKFIPKEFFIASKQQRTELLQGLCDSDAYCKSNKATYSTSSLQLAKDFRQLVLSLGGTSTISINHRLDKGEVANTEYTVTFRVPFNPFTLPRKAINYTIRPQDISNKKGIVSAEYVGIETGKCLVVDSINHLYVTRDYIVTHNTFLTKYFLNYIPNIKPMFTATTNEAVNQMEIAGVSNPITTHKALGLIPDFTKENISFKQDSIPDDFANSNILIVDEASMAGAAPKDSDDQLIVDYIVAARIRTLWIADSYQLPPVESKDGISPIFNKGWYNVTLTEVIRNKGDILAFCTSLRSTIDSAIKRMPVVPKEIKSISYKKFIEMSQGQEFLNSVFTGKTKVIAWKNKTVDVNNEIMRKAYHNSEEYLLPKDIILFTSPMFNSKDFPETLEDLLKMELPSKRASINAKAEIVKCSLTEMYGVECYLATVRVEKGMDTTTFIPTKNGLEKLAKLKKAIQNNIANGKAKWETWHRVDMVFTKFKHAGAITTHRAQGATIDNVIVNVSDILSGANRSPLLAYKMLYTACSRAKNNLTLIRNI